MPERGDLVAELHEVRRRFMDMVAEIRPELHRYCARMTGSTADGEDIVQDALMRAYYGLAELDAVPPLRPWLFRIAHNRALDHLRRYDHRMRAPADDALEGMADQAPDPQDALAREQAVQAAISRFIELPPAQRSSVILKDVLGHSLEEIAALLELSVPAVKAALHRGRVKLRALQSAAALSPPAPPRPASPEIARYARLFNSRDWDAVRAMLAEDVRLDLVSVKQRTGRHDVGAYPTNYGLVHDWHLVPAWVDGREALAVFRTPDALRPAYFIELTFSAGAVTSIRDFRYVPYIAADAEIVLAPPPPAP